jgi:hypothetical protein
MKGKVFWCKFTVMAVPSPMSVSTLVEERGRGEGPAWPCNDEDGMNVKSTCLLALLLNLGGVSTAWSQVPNLPAPFNDTATPPAVATNGTDYSPVNGTIVNGTMSRPHVAGLSNWIIGPRPCDCCGPLGGDGCLGYELYLREGLTAPMSSVYLGQTLSLGWAIQGGGRTLFFNPDGNAAWTVDLGVGNDNNHGRHPDKVAKLHNIIVPSPYYTGENISVPEVSVTVASLNRTYVTLALGYEYYLLGCGQTCSTGCCSDADRGLMWRFGLDVAGRYGSAKLQMHELRHRTDVFEGLTVALHTDVEIPCGCCLFFFGPRVEFNYDWLNILQDNDANLRSINVLLNLGTRF